MSTDPRIAEVNEAYYKARNDRAELMRTMYAEGMPIQQIKEEFNTAWTLLHKEVPEAFIVKTEEELYIHNPDIRSKTVEHRVPKPIGYKEPEYSEPEFTGWD